MSKLIFKEKDVKDYENIVSCFGQKNIPGEQMGYDSEEPVCIDCPSLQKCVLLIETNGKAPEFLEALAKYSGKTSEKTPEIPEEETQETSEKSPENLPEITREQVRVEIEDCVKAFDPNLKFVYKTLQNRDKIYVNDVEFFDTTKSTLKFCKIKEGAEIGLTPEEYGDSHTGISIDYEIGIEKINFSINEYLLKKLGRKPVEENISEIEPEIVTEEEEKMYQVDLSPKQKEYGKKLLAQMSVRNQLQKDAEKKEENLSAKKIQEETDLYSNGDLPEKTSETIEQTDKKVHILRNDGLVDYSESDPYIDFEITFEKTTTSCEIKFNGNCCVSDLVKVFSKIREAAEKLSI